MGFFLSNSARMMPANPKALLNNSWLRCNVFPSPPTARIYISAEAKLVWQIREAGPRAAAFAPGAPPEWEGWDDAAVAPEKLGSYLRGIRKLLDEYNYKASFYGHFGHGCIHMRVSFDLLSDIRDSQLCRFY